jgi:hypothetical protein
MSTTFVTTEIKRLQDSTSLVPNEIQQQCVTKGTPESRDSELQQVVWRNVILFLYAHLAALYGLYLTFTKAKFLTVLWGKYLNLTALKFTI